jgi:phosphoglycerate kinase
LNNILTSILSSILSVEQVPLAGKKALIRVDFNVPMKDGVITNDARIRAAIPTIELVLERCAGVILVSHLGRPIEGEYDQTLSLEPIANHLADLMKKPVRFEKNYWSNFSVYPGEIVMLENCRFNPGEKADDEELARQLAGLCDVFVMDAFGTAHRAEASTHGIAEFSEVACGGLLLMRELEALHAALESPESPMLAIVGGAKVSSKLKVLDALIDKVDQLIVGGGIANTFLAAAGFPIGKSLVEKELIPEAKKIMEKIHRRGGVLPLPVDVVVAKVFDEYADFKIKPIEQVSEDDLILDIGPKTAELFSKIILEAKTILWNGPVGVFEFESFSQGTRAVALAVAASQGYSLAGGGDTMAAIEKFNVEENISYISTGGGAFLEFVEGKKLPAIQALQIKAKESHKKL